jgi:hypothetical protein
LVSKCVKALNGTGIDGAGAPLLVLAALVLPLAAAGRVVPLTDVVAFDDVPVEVLAFDNTFELALDEDDSAEDVFTLPVFTFDGVTADVEDPGEDAALLVEVGVSFAFPGDAAAPEPAPDDDPAVFDAMAVAGVPMEVD